MRIVVGGFSHETNTFSTVPTRRSNFQSLGPLHNDDLLISQLLRGEELLQLEAVKYLRRNDVEVIPTIYASALPSGPVDRRAYDKIKNELIGSVKSAGKIDGICLFLHGASQINGIGEGEYDLVKSLREVVGEDVLISVSLDLHGNISPDLTEITNILTSYRAAPHTDAVETRIRAASLLIDCINKGISPISVLMKPPVMLPGEKVITDIEPAASLVRRLAEIDNTPGILNSSLLVGFAWSDTYWAGASIIVVAEKDEKKAHEKASLLADEYWRRRSDFGFEVQSGSIEETIKLAVDSPKRPVFISDSGDNVTAGAGGDIPLVLEKLVASNASDVLVAGIADSNAVKSCRDAGIGAGIKIELGGKLDSVNGSPYEARGKVMRIVHDSVLFRIKDVDVIITEERKVFTTLEDIKVMGVDPLLKKIVVVKLGYLFPELRRAAALALMALSPGFSNLLINNLTYTKVRRPIFPLNQDFSWKARIKASRTL